jgi:hypothetical protein
MGLNGKTFEAPQFSFFLIFPWEISPPKTFSAFILRHFEARFERFFAGVLPRATRQEQSERVFSPFSRKIPSKNVMKSQHFLRRAVKI